MTEDLHTKWSHRWLSPKAEARQSSIEGLGVFAKEDIAKGEYIGVLGGVIVPTTRKELEQKGVFNHSCEPNIGFNDSITFVAMRGIKQGEELVFDYAFNETYHHGFDCNCGSKNCRKHIKSDDWKLKEIQDKYKNYFSPYLSKIMKINNTYKLIISLIIPSLV